MRRFYDRDNREPPEDQTKEKKETDITLNVANVHLHCAVCNLNSNLPSKDRKLKEFYDKLAARIKQYQCRLVCGDFNMDTIRVVTELRCRGFCANVASWFVWNKTGGDFPKQNEEVLGSRHIQLDSVLIILIGPCSGLRLPFNESVFGMEPPDPPSVVAECCQMMTKKETQKGKVVSEKEYDLERYSSNGSGHQLSAYRPNCAKTKAELIKWMNTKMPYNHTTRAADDATFKEFRKWLKDNEKQPAVAGYKEVQTDIGYDTWLWPKFPTCKSKPQSIFYFNQLQKIFNGGSHIPIITFIGDSKDSRHGWQTRKNRDGKAANRGIGWDYASRKKREEEAKLKEQQQWNQSGQQGGGYQQHWQQWGWSPQSWW